MVDVVLQLLFFVFIELTYGDVDIARREGLAILRGDVVGADVLRLPGCDEGFQLFLGGAGFVTLGLSVAFEGCLVYD